MHARHNGPESGRKARPATGTDRDSAIAEQRFRAFVSPHPIATSVTEDLKLPRPEAPQFNADMTYPVETIPPQDRTDRDGIAAGPPEMTAPSQNSERIVAMNDEPAAQGSNADAAADGPRPNDDAGAAAGQIALPGQGISESSWIKFGFLAWGGLLTIGSMIRLFVG